MWYSYFSSIYLWISYKAHIYEPINIHGMIMLKKLMVFLARVTLLSYEMQWAIGDKEICGVECKSIC